MVQRRGSQSPAPEITLKGSIMDGESGLPMAYTTISVFSKRDSSLLGGGITDENGKYEVIGIINIVLKEDERGGFNGSLDCMRP